MHQPKTTEPCPHCGRFANRGMGIDAVIIRDGKILLIKRGGQPYKGLWALPGGYVEWDEHAEETVKREVLEETGLTVIATKLLNVYTDPKRHPKHGMAIAYITSVKDGSPKAGDDAEDIQWFSLEKLPEVLAFDHCVMIEEAKQRL